VRIKALHALWLWRGPLLPKVEDVHKNFLLCRKSDRMIDGLLTRKKAIEVLECAQRTARKL